MGERTILVADRDELSRTATTAILKRLNFEVVEADCSRSVLNHAHGPYSCVILDFNLMEPGSFDLCRRLLGKAGWNWTPVIFTSSRLPQVDVRMEMQAAGFDHLVKPFRADQLLSSLGDALAIAGEMERARPDREFALCRAEAAADR